MWWAMAAQAGFSLLGSAQSNSTAKQQRALTEYQNKMRLLSNAANQNAITQNETFAAQESIAEAINIQKNSLRAQGMAEVAAAVAGVKGNSVGNSLVAISRDTANADMTRRVNLHKDLINLSVQRESSRFGTLTSLDLRTHKGESLGETFLGAGQAAFGTYLQYQ